MCIRVALNVYIKIKNMRAKKTEIIEMKDH